ncbi:MAG: transcriptional regulator GcvA [Pseudomonadota bacterium]
MSENDRLPPLTALRAFDAAARHMSFAKAADELFVTPAALSYQIKQLETHFGLPLFRRLNRAVELTEAGRALAAHAAEGFAAFRNGARAVARLSDSRALTVTAGPAFTAKWLAPRMFRFAEAHPELDLRFVAALRVMDLEAEGIDIAIRFGPGDHEKGAIVLPLEKDWLTPMCTPEQAETLKTPQDLVGRILLHDDSLKQHESWRGIARDWPAWCKKAGVEGLDPARGPRFSNADHALDAAMDGAGVVLGRLLLAERDLTAGRLVVPFADQVLPIEATYRFVCPPGYDKRPGVVAFREWLVSEIARSHAAIAPYLPAASRGGGPSARSAVRRAADP